MAQSGWVDDNKEKKEHEALGQTKIQVKEIFTWSLRFSLTVEWERKLKNSSLSSLFHHSWRGLKYSVAPTGSFEIDKIPSMSPETNIVQRFASAPGAGCYYAHFWLDERLYLAGLRVHGSQTNALDSIIRRRVWMWIFISKLLSISRVCPNFWATNFVAQQPLPASFVTSVQ